MNRPCILVVEDEGIVAADIQERLNRLGYQATSVPDGSSALQRIPDVMPHLVLMDIVLPGGADGIETAIELRRKHDIPVVFLTAHADEATLLRAKKAEASGYIIKPFEEKGLQTIIELALQKHRMEVAERRREEQEERFLAVQLQQSQKLESIGKLAAGIVHEINTPAQFLRDNTRFLRRAFDDLTKLLSEYRHLVQAVKTQSVTESLLTKVDEAERATEFEYLVEEIPTAISESLDGVERVVSIVQAMKEFAHPGTEMKQQADLNRAIESTLIVTRSQWKGVADVIKDLDPRLPAVPCCLNEINQAILNLIVNAADAITEAAAAGRSRKGTIWVATRQVQDSVEIQIKDDGTGIPELIQSRIFDPFFTTKPAGQGTGQGLAIVHDVIVNRHGGSVSFASTPGHGSTFIIRLPVHSM